MEQELRRLPLGNGVEIYVSPHHTFGTDAVLLADFARHKKNDRVVDIGTGCGIIPFLMLRDGLEGSVCGIDISEEATSLAARTAEYNGFSGFEAVNCDIKCLSGRVEFGKATLVTCNPPYKADNAGIQNPDSVLRTARHETQCSLEDVVSTAAKLLQTSGRFCVCHRPERLAELMSLMRSCKIEPKRMRIVCQKSGREPWLVLVEGKRCANTGLRIMPPLFVENENGTLTDEMMRIYGPYKSKR